MKSNNNSNIVFLRVLITVLMGIVHGITGPGGILRVIPTVKSSKWNLAILYWRCFYFSSTLIMGRFAVERNVCSSKMSASRLPYYAHIPPFPMALFWVFFSFCRCHVVNSSSFGNTWWVEMSVIPQQRVLFNGCSIRENLNPFGEHREEKIRKRLAFVQMMTSIDT